jgi:hypothetical protein
MGEAFGLENPLSLDTAFDKEVTKESSDVSMMIILLLFFQKQNLASTIYLFGLGSRLSGPGLKHMR